MPDTMTITLWKRVRPKGSVYLIRAQKANKNRRRTQLVSKCKVGIAL